VHFGTASTELLIDGSLVGLDGPIVSESNPEKTETRAISVSVPLFEPGKALSHTLTAQVSDNCGTQGGNSGGHFRIDSIAIDVVGLR
jgi:hypothetical protein